MHSEDWTESKEAGRVQAIKLVAYTDDVLILTDEHTCRIQTERLERNSKKIPEVIDANTKVKATSPEESHEVGI